MNESEETAIQFAERTRLPGTPEPTHFWPGADGVTIAGEEWGDPEGPLVLLLHGGGQTRHAWKGTGRRLGAIGYHAIALDARGHGDSSWAANAEYTMDAMVADLANVVDSLGKRPVLVGASMGGTTSLGAVGEGQLDATALVLVDIAPRIEPDGAQRVIQFMRRHTNGFTSIEEVAETIAAYQSHRQRPQNLAGLAKNLRRGEDGRYYWHWDPRFLSGKRDLDAYVARLESCARNLTLPTLLVRGGLSDVLSEAGAQSFLRTCPQAEYVNITDAAHMVAGDRNDVFAGAVSDFLSRTVPPDGTSVPATCHNPVF